MATKPPPSRPDTQLRPRRKKPTSRIEVALRSKPRHYVPGSGPPLQRICLLPPQDSTAYIVERILLPSPGPAADGKPLPRRMTYVIGWRDFPAARHLVPAMQILDYVSPRALEEWEFDMEAELDEDRKKMSDEKHTSSEKKGRPPAHTAIESAAVAEPESATPTRMKMGAMSLSTPHKARFDDFDGLSDDEIPSPSMQIAHEARWYMADDLDVDAIDDAKQSGLGSEWGSRGLGAIAVNGTSGVAHQPAPAPTSRPVPAPFVFSATQTPTGESSRVPRLPDGPTRVQSPAPALGGFTPFNGFSQQRPTPSATKPSREPTQKTRGSKTTTPAKRAKPRNSAAARSKSTPTARPVLDDNGEHVWVVQRLEDLAIYDVEGRGLVRYFQVRWEGDWPPDQNPTWEPEENIPPNMVRNFFKRGKKRRRAGTGHTRTPRAVEMSLGASLHYNSVSEAFAGEVADGAEADGDVRDVGVTAGLSHDGGDESELFVIEEEHARPAKAARAGNGRQAPALGPP